MRAFIMMTMLSLGMATAAAAPGNAAPSQDVQPFCVSGRGCVATTPSSYNACFQLGLQRGYNTSRDDRRNLELFIYQCLAGKIPR